MKSEKGITLATLVITIVVMLILAGTTAFTLNNSKSVLRSEEQIKSDFKERTDDAESNESTLHDQWRTVIDKKGVDTELSVP
jgi:cell division protein FtsX